MRLHNDYDVCGRFIRLLLTVEQLNMYTFTMVTIVIIYGEILSVYLPVYKIMTAAFLLYIWKTWTVLDFIIVIIIKICQINFQIQVNKRIF